MKVAILDVGAGNIGAVRVAFERLGVEPATTRDPAALASADRVVLPGVGAAGFVMERIRALGLEAPIRGLTSPVLGVCLGMQILFEHSEEGDTPCLGLLPGRVRRLEPAPDRPVPHMGWSRVSVRDDTTGLEDGDYLYFAHGYACDDGPWTAAAADYGQAVPAVVRRDNWLGAQFHPERSGEAGARFLQRFVAG